jgi:hypothetical protein
MFYIVCLMSLELHENLKKRKSYSHFTVRIWTALITKGHRDLIFWIFQFSHRCTKLHKILRRSLAGGGYHSFYSSVTLSI